MPTLEHNGLVELFRQNPGLAPHLLETLFHLPVPPHTSILVAEAALDQLIPVEFRADLVLDLRDDQGRSVLAIILEMQREKDPRKKRSWPTYLAAVHARNQCPTVVLVVTTDADVATWAAEPIDLGLGLSVVKPLVLGPATVPEVTSAVVAEEEQELSILSAIAHGNGPNGLAVVFAALAALGRLDQEHAAVYFQIIYGALREPMRRALEKKIMEQRSEAKASFPPFMEKLIEGGRLEGRLEGKLEGKLEGRLEGKLEGRLEGKLEGRLEGSRQMLLRLLARAGIAITAEERSRILSCDDVALLDRWIENILAAKTADDVFA